MNAYKTGLFPGIQSFCGALGKWSCYAFCLLKIAETVTGETINAIAALDEAISRKWIYYNWDNHNDSGNLFVEEPEVWLQEMTGKFWVVTKVYEKPKTGFYVECWNNAHFRLPDWDSLSYSNSVATGKITSYRALVIM